MTVDPNSLISYIDGKPYREEGVARFDVVNPATGKTLTSLADVGEGGVNAAVNAAAQAASSWARTTPKDRAIMMLELVAAIEARADELATLETWDMGMPLNVARGHMFSSADKYRFFAGVGRSLEAVSSGEYKPGITSILRRQPIGVVAAIAPWNYPFALTSWKLAPALIAGNTVVLKPSTETSMSALLLAEIAAGILPPGVLNVVTGSARNTGIPLVRHPKVGLVSITGGTPAGKQVMKDAADHVKRVHLELGGKAPAVVFDDVDLDRLVAGVRAGGFTNAGQDCTAMTRLYVPRSRSAEIVEAITEMASSIELDDPFENPDTPMGPLVSTRHRDSVAGFVDRALATGHITATTGAEFGREVGSYYRPTILVGARQNDEVVQQEIFGPVVSVVEYDTEAQAIEYANDTPYGLAASVWSSNIDRALRTANAIEAGSVWINDHGPTAAEMPFGGFKQSGIGRDLSKYAIEEHTELKHIAITVASS
ncbi:aldehyde dehydrogenase family protein [Rhodococcus koreensis]